MAVYGNFELLEERLRRCIKEERLKGGITQAELARRGSTLRPSTVAKFEAGQTPNITLKSIFEMATAASLPLSELIKKAENYEDQPKEVPWERLIKDVSQLPEEKRNWLARVLQEALKGSV